MIVFVYQDSDHGVIEVFDNMEKAQEFAKEQWGHEPEWESIGHNGVDICDTVSDYIRIYKREVR